MRWMAPASLLVILAALSAPFAAEPEEAPRPKAASAARLANAADVRKALGLVPEYQQVPNLEQVKVAVLDYGFDGFDGDRQYLPEGTVVVEHYDPEFVRRHGLGDPDYRKAFAPGNRHGRVMAQIVWGVTGFQPRGPKFYLLNANGPTMLRRAVRYAVEQKVDLILFSGVFEGGGNGDGRGAINRIVADALSAGILWINAAGNFGGRVYNGPIHPDRDGFVRFRDGFDGTSLRFRNRLDENTVTLTLTWNDYREEEDAGTRKDLDLIVEDWKGNRVGASEKVQVAGDAPAGAEESRNPRERVVLTGLPANTEYNYRIRVKARTDNFTTADRLRVLVTANRETYADPQTGALTDAVKFFDASNRGEIYPPADNPQIVTVGDSSPGSSVGPTADHRVKPDFVLEDSRAFFSDGEVSAGSSNAAAYLAGVVAVLKAAQPQLQPRHLFRLAHRGTAATTSGTVQSTSPASPPKTASPPRPAAPTAPSRPGTPWYPAEAWEAQARRYGVYPPYGGYRQLPGDYPFFPNLVLPGQPRLDPMDRLGGLPARPSSELLPTPGKVTVGTDARAPYQGRLWKTPTRQQLADLIRSMREV